MLLIETLKADAEALRIHRGRLGPFVHPNLTAVVMYRIAQALRRRGLVLPARAVSIIGQLLTGADIDPQADIGPGLSIAHTYGVVIGEGVRAGSHLRLYGGAVLGATINDRRGSGSPTLGDDVVVWSKATVAGPITIGSRAQIGAHAVVMRPVDEGAVIAGFHV